MERIRRSSLALATLLLADAASARPPEKAPPILDLSRVRIVDLTHNFDEKTLYWPTAPSTFKLTSLARGQTEGGFFYSANSFCAPEHGGTHLDAPVHFAEGRDAADQIPLTRLIAPGVVIDVSRQAGADADYRLSAADVRAWEGRHGAIAPGTIVLLRTGWGARWPDRARYFGSASADATKLHFPAYGKEAAELLVKERKAAALGVDTASIDHGPSQDFAVHQVVNGANVPAFENVAQLEQVSETGAWIVALPMKIAGGSGGPLRIVALVPR
jgi:kynurenine formamidase